MGYGDTTKSLTSSDSLCMLAPSNAAQAITVANGAGTQAVTLVGQCKIANPTNADGTIEYTLQDNTVVCEYFGKGVEKTRAVKTVSNSTGTKGGTSIATVLLLN